MDKKIFIIKVIMNVVTCVMFALGLVFLVPALSPNKVSSSHRGCQLYDDTSGYTYVGELRILPKTKYDIKSVEVSVVYYDGAPGLDDDFKIINTKTIKNYDRPPLGSPIKVEWTEQHFISLEYMRIKVKAVVDNSADLTKGIVFICISAISLGVLLYFVFSPKYNLFTL